MSPLHSLSLQTNTRTTNSPTPLTEWHSIRPWAPHLALAAREITSVSATFILSSSLSSTDASISIDGDDGSDHARDWDHTDDTSNSMSTDASPMSTVKKSPNRQKGPAHNIEEDSATHAYPPAPAPPHNGKSSRATTIISTALAQGLSVDVNGAPWQRVLLRVDDPTDEAIIVVYGLMPGRQYDIELGLVRGEGESMRETVTTRVQDYDLVHAESEQQAQRDQATYASSSGVAIPCDSLISTTSNVTVNTSANSTSCLHPSSAATATHASSPTSTAGLQASSASPLSPSAAINAASSLPPTPPPTFDDHTHTLALLTADRASIATSLKAARRASQKADALVRSEVDGLRRASERHAAGEHRARQKVLALQEASKRAAAGAEAVHVSANEVEGEASAMREREREREVVLDEVKREEEEARRRRDEGAQEEGWRRAEGMRGELGTLNRSIERLGARQEKLEGAGGVLDALEEELREIERERERVENDPFGYGAGGGNGRKSTGEDGALVGVNANGGTTGRKRSHHPSHSHPPGTIARPPPPAPIQRPRHNQNSSLSHHVPTLGNIQNHGQSPPHRTGLRNYGPALPSPQSQSGSSSSSSPASVSDAADVAAATFSINTAASPGLNASLNTTAPVPTSTLSGRAPPFEPSMNVRAAMNTGSRTRTGGR